MNLSAAVSRALLVEGVDLTLAPTMKEDAMSSPELSVLRIKLINRLIDEISKLAPTRNAERELAAAHTAAIRSLNYSMSEGDLRAVIYDAMFRPSRAVQA